MSSIFSLLDRGGVFSPRDIGGLALWLDASDSATVTMAGAKVAALSDKSGTGNHAAQDTDAIRPDRLTAAQNGLSVMDFDHVTHEYLTVPASATLANFWNGGGYLALVAKVDSDGGGNEGRFINNNASDFGGWNFETVEDNLPTTSDCRVRLVVRFSGAYATWKTTNRVVGLDSYHILEVHYDAASTANDPVMLVDGVSAAITENSAPSGTLVDDTGRNFGIGGMGLGLDGKIGEALLYGNIPSQAERASIRAYLAAKWGISA